MKVISPGVVALRPFRIEIDTITADMVHWWVMVGGEVKPVDKSYHNSRGKLVKDERVYMRMGEHGDWCHYHQNGTSQVTLHLREEYAPEASLFILKFHEHVLGHTIQVKEPQLD